MKYAISFFITINAFSSPINLFHEQEAVKPEQYKDLLVHDYQIPEDLIAVRPIEKCEELKQKGKLDLCLKNNGDLLLVSVDYNFINESLKVFRAP